MDSQTDSSDVEHTLAQIFAANEERIAREGDEDVPHRRRAARGTGPVERSTILLITVLSGLAGALSGASPTGWSLADAGLTGGFAALVTFAGSRSRRWPWVWCALVATLSAQLPELLVAAVALACSAAAALHQRRRRWLGALIGALSMHALLRMPVQGFTGLSALLAVSAVAPLVTSAYRQGSRQVKRRLKLWLLGLAALVLVPSAGAAATALAARGSIERGLDLARSAMDAARDGETEEAAALLADAADEFRSGNRLLGGWWTAPSRAIPVVGQHVRALEVASDQGRAIAEAGNAAASAVDLDAMTWEQGRLDLDLLEMAQAPLQTNADALRRALVGLEAVESPWILGAVSRRIDELSEELADVYPEASFAAEAARLGPEILGASRKMTYFVVFTTPSEARGMGGFMGSWAELTAEDGKLSLTRSGRTAELENAGDPEARMIQVPDEGPASTWVADYLRRYGSFDPANSLRDVTFSPDFPTVGEVIRQLYPQSGGTELDGVLLIDPYALAALMKFTGPISVQGLDQPLTSRNAAEFLMVTQYSEFPERSERVDFLAEATRVTFEALTTGDLPGPRRLADTLAPLARNRRIAMFSPDPDVQALFQQAGVDGAISPAPLDYISVVSQNAGNNKIDAYLHRQIDYAVTADPATGRLEAIATVTLTNALPSLELPEAVIGNRQGDPPGTNEMYLNLYSTLDLVGATLDGEPVGVEANRELGRKVYALRFSIAPGASRTVTFRLEGVRGAFGEYTLGWGSQPLVNEDEVRITVRPAGGAVISGFDRSGLLRPAGDGRSAVAEGALADSPLLKLDMRP